MGAMTFAFLFLLPSLVFSWELFDEFEYVTYTLPNNTIGPASISFANDGFSAYTGISNGYVVNFNLLTGSITPFAWEPDRNATLCDTNTDPSLFPTCGRALGLDSNSSGYLYFCDYTKGLFGVCSSGGEATQLVASADGLPVYFCNAVELGSNGTVYFTDASQVYRNTTLQIENDDTTGRLLKYEPTTGEVTVLADGLAGPTGMTISSDGSYLLVSEIVGSRILKYYLSGTNATAIETLTSCIYRPANIRRGQIGDYFYVSQTPIPYYHYLAKIDCTGDVQQNITIGGPYKNVTYFRDARRVGFSFYIGSRYAPFIGLKTFTI